MPNETSLGRRDALAVLAGLGLTAMTPLSSMASAAPRRVDVHFHPMIPEWVDAVAQTLPSNIVAKERAWTPQSSLADMDRNHIETAVCSVTIPGVWLGNVAQARKLARTCNDYMANMVRTYPGRFGLFAALPLPDIEGSLAELAYAFDTLKADGVGLFTSYGDKWIADPMFAPVFKELNRRKAVAYVHPTAPSCCRQLVPGIPAALMEYPIDTSRAILDWMMTNSSSLYPDLHMIFSHAGSLFMAAVGRLQILSDTQPDFSLPRNVAAEAAKLHYEISSSADKVTMDLLRSYVPVSQILLGTDSPLINDVTHNLKHFEGLRLAQEERRAIERDNALRLMPHLGKAI